MRRPDDYQAASPPPEMSVEKAARIIDTVPTEYIDAVETYLYYYRLEGLMSVFNFVREARRDRSSDQT